ncbi:MAG: DUF3099 domain-containing protein [Leucobacter sp.]
MAKSFSVTSAGVNPTEDRAHRMRMYFFAMTLRVLCVVSLFWVRGWWVLIVAAGAIFLPWFAVMVGNAVAHGGEEAPQAPEPLQLGSVESEQAEPTVSASETLLVVDVEPVRRAPESSEGASTVGFDGPDPETAGPDTAASDGDPA